MKYIYVVLGLFVSLVVSADPQMGDNGVHFPLSNEYANYERECKNCDGSFERNRNGQIEHGYYSELIRVPLRHADYMEKYQEFSSLEADFGCNLVNGNNAKNVRYWRVTYNVLPDTCEKGPKPTGPSFCSVQIDFHCSQRAWRVFPELYGTNCPECL